MLTEQVLRQAIDRVVAAAREPTRVILFGSYARGEADEASDLDLLVVEPEIPDFTEEYRRLREALGPIGIGVDLLLYSEPEFQKRREWWTTPVYWAVREGKVVYESPT
jgi:predicted nucleotidyltransferase